jgi:protein-S-isoprenylcysteine O-methyltransferase Ste14
MNKSLYIKVALQLLLFPIVMGALLFLPAGTLDYWEAWVFVAVFFVCTVAITMWLIVNDPKLLERRLKAGPAAEKEPTQKVIMVVALLSFAGVGILPALDHRFGWSVVPTSILILGDVLIALSYLAFYFVFRENPYGAATIQVE